MKVIDLEMDYEGGHLLKVPEKSGYFPTLTYDGPNKLELPDYGVIKIRYRKVRSSESKTEDRESYSCTIEALQILDVKGEREEAEEESPTKNSSRGSEEALDKLMKEKRDSY